MSRRVMGAALLAALALGCGEGEDSLTQNEIFHRMQRQPKYRAYQGSVFFEDGRAMRTPPANTLSREDWVARQIGDELGPDGQLLTQAPIPVTLENLQTGKKQFDIVCASCHGMLGDGQSMVSANFAHMPAPSFHSQKLLEKPDGYFYQVATHGFGNMPPFGWRMTPKERWALVAYIRTLQYSQRVPAAELPPEGRAALDKEAR